MVFVVVLTDKESGNQALYVDDVLVLDDETVYACDIAAYAKEQPMTLKHEVVDLPFGSDWPKSRSDANQFRVTEEAR